MMLTICRLAAINSMNVPIIGATRKKVGVEKTSIVGCDDACVGVAWPGGSSPRSSWPGRGRHVLITLVVIVAAVVAVARVVAPAVAVVVVIVVVSIADVVCGCCE